MRYINRAIIAGVLFFTSTAWAGCTSIPASTPDSQLQDNGDGTVNDLATGLMWKQCSDAGCSGTATTHTWQQALQIPDSLNVGGGFAGYSDWRLPNVKELRSLVEKACYNPAINSTRFPNTSSSDFWSASASAGNSSYAWAVNFNYGYSYGSNRSDGKRVRLVRGGQ